MALLMDGTPYDRSLPGPIFLRKRGGNAFVDQGSSYQQIRSGIQISTAMESQPWHTNRNFAGVGTAVVTPVIIDSTDGGKVIRLRMLLQLNQDWIQEVIMVGWIAYQLQQSEKYTWSSLFSKTKPSHKCGEREYPKQKLL